MPQTEKKNAADALVPILLTGIGNRINAACRDIGGRSSAAAAAGVSDDMLRRYIREESRPPFEVVVKLARAAGRTLDWMADGDGADSESTFGAADSASGAADSLGNPVDVSEFVFIPRYNVEAAAGHGQAVTDETPVHSMAFRRHWVENCLCADPANLSVVSVKGDSQQGVLNDRDIILIDRSRTTGSAGLYVLRIDGDIIVKTLQRLPGGRLEVSSANPAYKPFEVCMTKAPADFAIIGQVVWFGRRV